MYVEDMLEYTLAVLAAMIEAPSPIEIIDPRLETWFRQSHGCHTFGPGGVTLCGQIGGIGLPVPRRMTAGGYPGGKCHVCKQVACEVCALELAYRL